MITPDDDVVNILDGGTSLVGELADSSALIESGEGAEVLLGDGGGVVGADQSVGVGWVSNDGNLDGLLGDLVDGGTLSLENLSVGLEEVGTLHSWASGASTDENADISVLETNKRVGGGDDVLHTSVSAILELHDETLEDLLCGWELDQLHDHLSVWSEHSSLSDEVAKEGADLTSGTGDGDTDGWLLEVTRHSGEVATEGLKSVHEDVVLCHFVVLS